MMRSKVPPPFFKWRVALCVSEGKAQAGATYGISAEEYKRLSEQKKQE